MTHRVVNGALLLIGALMLYTVIVYVRVSPEDMRQMSEQWQRIATDWNAAMDAAASLLPGFPIP